MKTRLVIQSDRGSSSSGSSSSHLGSNQQVQPGTQLCLGPDQCAQVAHAQGILQSLLDAILGARTILVLPGSSTSGRGLRLPPADSLEEVPPDFGVGLTGARGDFLDVRLDLGEVLGESGDALRESLERGLRGLSGLRVGRGDVGGEEVDCGYGDNGGTISLPASLVKKSHARAGLTSGLFGQLVLDAAGDGQEDGVLRLGCRSDLPGDVSLDSQARVDVLLREVGVKRQVNGRGRRAGLAVEKVLDEGRVRSDVWRGGVPGVGSKCGSSEKKKTHTPPKGAADGTCHPTKTSRPLPSLFIKSIMLLW